MTPLVGILLLNNTFVEWASGPASRVLSLTLPAPPKAAPKLYPLADPARQPLATRLEGGRVLISVPAAAPDPVASLVVVETEPAPPR